MALPQVNQPSEAFLPGPTEPPTTPGVYWSHRAPISQAIMVEVRLKNGKLVVLCPPLPDETVAT